MKERPILFSGAMVLAILNGEKTQTRRVVKGTPGAVLCPYGNVGDRLWVREKWRCDELETGQDGVRYAADDVFRPIENTSAAAEAWVLANRPEVWRTPWRPSIHMPRWASRITLEIVAVRPELVQEITESDARAEGVGSIIGAWVYEFSLLWDEINASRGYSWSSNPWVWVIEFKRVIDG